MGSRPKRLPMSPALRAGAQPRFLPFIFALIVIGLFSVFGLPPVGVNFTARAT